MSVIIQASQVIQTIEHAAQSLLANADYFTALDQEVGDGDLGITMAKAANALLEYIQTKPISDIGSWLASAGMAVNRAAPSTMGTLLSTALMRAGKEVKEKEELSLSDLSNMFKAADKGIQERGQAHLGDKTIVDSLHPAAEAFASTLENGDGLAEAGAQALAAAKNGRDAVTPQRNKIGRASWVGERTEGKIDPGCAVCVVLINAIVQEQK